MQSQGGHFEDIQVGRARGLAKVPRGCKAAAPQLDCSCEMGLSPAPDQGRQLGQCHMTASKALQLRPADTDLAYGRSPICAKLGPALRYPPVASSSGPRVSSTSPPSASLRQPKSAHCTRLRGIPSGCIRQVREASMGAAPCFDEAPVKAEFRPAELCGVRTLLCPICAPSVRNRAYL